MLTIAIRVTRSSLARLLLVLMACFALASGEAFAQTTGDLGGVVSDEDEFPLGGVTVKLSGAQLIGGQQDTVSDNAGRYRFTALPPGLYRVVFVKEGFRSVTVDNIQVNVNRQTVQNVVMQAGEDTEVVKVVGGQQTIDTESTTVGQVLTRDFLQKIPTGRSYQQAVQLAAGVTGGSNPNMGGASSNENTYLLDGAQVTDPVTGTFGNNFNFDAIQQIEVLLGGLDAEFGQSLGGIVNVVTLSGTNNLEFDSSIYYINGNWRPRKDDRWTRDGFQLAPSGFDQSLQILQVAAQVSGPLVRDKAWFLFSYQYVWNRQNRAGVPQRIDIQGHQILSKLTIQPTDAHRITVLFQTDPATFDNIQQGSLFQRPEAQARQFQSGFVGQLRWQWFLNEDMNLDTRVSMQRIFLGVSGVPCTNDRTRDEHRCRPGEQEGFLDVSTPGRAGTNGAFDSINWPFYNLDDRWRVSAGTKFSLLGIVDPLGGLHDFKFGIEGNQFINNSVIGFAGNTQFVDSNFSNFDPDSLTNFYWLETSGPIFQRNTGSTWNFFLQDAYKPISNLTIKYGIRFDSTVLRNDLGDPVVRGNLWGPRLFAAWDPFNDQKTKISGGYGRFNDTGRQEVSSFTNRASFGSKLYLGELFTQDPVALQDQLAQLQPRRNLNLSNDVLRLPTLDQFILSFQRQIVKDVSFGVNFTANFTRHLYDFDETNLIYDEDGSAVIGTRRANPLLNYFRLRTPREARRNYYRVDLFLDKVFSRRWGGRLNYSYAFGNGTNNSSLQGTFSNDPQTRYTYGQLVTFRNHSIDAFGFWLLPTDPYPLTIGINFEYESGQPLERFYWGDSQVTFGSYEIRIRPRGQYFKFNDYWSAGIRLIQDIKVRKGTLQIDLSVQNIFNARAPDGFFATLYSEGRLFISDRQSPLTMQLGLRYQF